MTGDAGRVRFVERGVRESESKEKKRIDGKWKTREK